MENELLKSVSNNAVCAATKQLLSDQMCVCAVIQLCCAEDC